MSDSDPEIVIVLPLSAMRLILQHLYLGLYVGNPVSHIANAIIEQANLQIALAAPPKPIGDESAPVLTGSERLN